VTVDAKQIEQATLSAIASIRAASSLGELRDAESAATGKQGVLIGFRRELGSLEPEQKRELGALIHTAQEQLTEAVSVCRAGLEAKARAQELEADRLDLSETIDKQVRPALSRGHRHLVSQTRDALEDVFCAMGFSVADGPEVETDWYNFEALNIPPAHPARGMWDTFYAPYAYLSRADSPHGRSGASKQPAHPRGDAGPMLQTRYARCTPPRCLPSN
jgi:phenylalanyl-tRNA synthetase alpha chain